MGCHFVSAPRDCLTCNHVPPVRAESSKADRAALLTFFKATNGHEWSCSIFWGTHVDIAFWRGVEVNSEGRVDVLDLRDINLSGECLFIGPACYIEGNQKPTSRLRMFYEYPNNWVYCLLFFQCEGGKLYCKTREQVGAGAAQRISVCLR